MDDLEHKWNEIMDADEEDEEITEYELEKGKREVIEFEGIGRVEELPPPKVTSWIDPINGETMHGVKVTTNDLNHPKKKSESVICKYVDCTICCQPWTSNGDHQICCLPCGHIYGLSCINKWFSQSSSCQKVCPDCKTVCSSKDVKRLYSPRLCVAAHQKASSSTRYFPFTKEGFYEFNAYEWLRHADAKKLQSSALEQLTDIEREQLHHMTTHREKLSNWARGDALIKKLSIWADELGRVTDAYKPRIDFFNQMCKEHHKRLAQQKKEHNPFGAAEGICHKG